MKKVFSSFSFATLCFIIFFLCGFIIVCNIFTPFGYYAYRLLDIRLGGLHAPAFIIGVISFVSYVYSLWLRAEYEKPVFLKRIYNMVLIVSATFSILFIIACAAVMQLTANLVVMTLIAPFAAYSVLMLWISSAVYQMRKKNTLESFILLKFYKQFPVIKPIGLVMTFLLISSILVFLYELLIVYEKSLFILVLSFMSIVGISLLVQFLTRFSVLKSSEYEKVMAEKIKSERFKTELITNVSHDIKTPLTSIISYSNLINKMEFENKELQEYAAVLERKSLRLKMLIEDLIEASKAGTGNISVTLEYIDIVEIVGQIIGEFDEQITDCNLQIINETNAESVYILSDGRHLWRVMENIFSNAVKYAMEGTRIYSSIKKEEGKVVFTLKNTSKEQLNISPDELTEQFVRGDSARHTGGSGLGLYIAKSLTESIGGKFFISITGDLFEVMIVLNNNGS